MGMNIFQITDKPKEQVTRSMVAYYEEMLNQNFGCAGKITKIFDWCASFDGKSGTTYTPKEVLELFDENSAPYLMVTPKAPWDHMIEAPSWKALVSNLLDSQSIIFYKARL